MVKIRLRREGTKNRIFWRVVVSDAKMPRDGRFIEEIGYYDPLPMDEKIVIKKERLDYWLAQGAQITDTIKSLIKRSAKKGKAVTSK